jgi:hypothetical protein
MKKLFLAVVGALFLATGQPAHLNAFEISALLQSLT